MAITGLSMAAYARPVNETAKVGKALELLCMWYPEYPNFPIRSEDIRVFRVVPKLISVLDYAKGFGHDELVVL